MADGSWWTDRNGIPAMAEDSWRRVLAFLVLVVFVLVSGGVAAALQL